MKKMLFLLFVIVAISGCTSNDDTNTTNTTQYLVCVPATCCHPIACVPEDQAPDCSNVMCTMDCQPGTMDCGQGYCAVVNNKCTVIWN
ncbi:hypothetical protein GQ473_00990 [archaeon]|nr:hypothetical protein [archaeon]